MQGAKNTLWRPHFSMALHYCGDWLPAEDGYLRRPPRSRLQRLRPVEGVYRGGGQDAFSTLGGGGHIPIPPPKYASAGVAFLY